ncbi:hypothetical protein K438DRAFT_2050439 [Mycena galopus ATCC 62051]|nr:hypothetical protein K438DRAFT_2050439 [Mycena galopus ATCC 62051]
MPTLVTKAGMDWVLSGTAPSPDSIWAGQGFNGVSWTLLCPKDDAFKPYNLTQLYADVEGVRDIVSQHLVPTPLSKVDTAGTIINNNQALPLEDSATYGTLRSPSSAYGDIIFRKTEMNDYIVVSSAQAWLQGNDITAELNCSVWSEQAKSRAELTNVSWEDRAGEKGKGVFTNSYLRFALLTACDGEGHEGADTLYAPNVDVLLDSGTAAGVRVHTKPGLRTCVRTKKQRRHCARVASLRSHKNPEPPPGGTQYRERIQPIALRHDGAAATDQFQPRGAGKFGPLNSRWILTLAILTAHPSSSPKKQQQQKQGPAITRRGRSLRKLVRQQQFVVEVWRSRWLRLG